VGTPYILYCIISHPSASWLFRSDWISLHYTSITALLQSCICFRMRINLTRSAISHDVGWTTRLSLRVGFSSPEHNPVFVLCGLHLSLPRGLPFYSISSWNGFYINLGGTIPALPCMSYFDKTIYQKARVEAIASGTEVEPEKRLHALILGVTIMPVSLFW
jgi:hypothetical protein